MKEAGFLLANSSSAETKIKIDHIKDTPTYLNIALLFAPKAFFEFLTFRKNSPKLPDFSRFLLPFLQKSNFLNVLE